MVISLYITPNKIMMTQKKILATVSQKTQTGPVRNIICKIIY